MPALNSVSKCAILLNTPSVLSFAVPTCACLQVAVKVLDANAITRRDALTGLSLEVLLAERLRHPFIVNTKAWALVHGQVRGGGGGG